MANLWGYRLFDWEFAWNTCFCDIPMWSRYVKKYRWNFSNLEDAFQKGGILCRKEVYIFTHIEVLSPEVNENIYIPVFFVIESSFPPSDKLAFKSLQTGEYEEIFEMKMLGMARDYFRRRHHIRPLVPFIQNPRSNDVGTTVDIVYQTQAEAEPLHFEYHWEEEPKRFTDALITFNLLPAAHKDSFQELLRERGEEGRRAYQEALPAQEKLRAQGIDAEAFENMRVYKFYPVATDDTPDISSVKTRFINRYYGDADFLF
ncbi:hypothetical protein M8C21_017984 [Ambrosia artemisiifolia]|uniref:Uncharacterized protein n=1 Tax=Ambrosia artemisiifolia TaxID=4212 RepID=A0AAD5BS53_AMBAR|nr:hypothetical protein M8C21_017984 [Ambrosia artemisiifolia]